MLGSALSVLRLFKRAFPGVHAPLSAKSLSLATSLATETNTGPLIDAPPFSFHSRSHRLIGCTSATHNEQEESQGAERPREFEPEVQDHQRPPQGPGDRLVQGLCPAGQVRGGVVVEQCAFWPRLDSLLFPSFACFRFVVAIKKTQCSLPSFVASSIYCTPAFDFSECFLAKSFIRGLVSLARRTADVSLPSTPICATRALYASDDCAHERCFTFCYGRCCVTSRCCCCYASAAVEPSVAT